MNVRSACGCPSPRLCWCLTSCVYFQDSIACQPTFTTTLSILISLHCHTSRVCVWESVYVQQRAYHLTESTPPRRSCLHPHRGPGAGRRALPRGPRGTLQPGTGTDSYSTQGRCHWHRWSSASPCSGTSLGLGDSAEIVTELWLLEVTAVM